MTSTACYHECVRWVVLILLACGVASAGPTVEIRAQTQLSLSRVKLRDGGRVEVTGKLHDKLTGDGLAGQRVSVTIAGATHQATTESDGSFRLLVPGDAGQQDVTLGYEGGSRLEKAQPLVVKTDPAKGQLELVIAKVSDDSAGARLRITATDEDGQQVVVPVELAVGSLTDDKLRTLRTVETRGDFVFTRKEAGGAGVHRVRASFAGDDTRASASATVTLPLESNTTTTMSLSSTQLAFEDDLVVTGKVIDDDRKPIARAAVTLVSGDRRLAQGATTEEGTYRFEVEAEIIGHGPYGVQVQTDPGTAFVKSSRSQPMIIRIAPPQPVPVSYTIAAFLATALAAGGFFAARTKPWRKLRRPAPPAELPSEEGEIEIQTGGLVTAKPGVVATLRRPHDDSFSGVVRDTVRGRPIADATVELILGDRRHSLVTAADGSFAIEKLDAGEWRAEVAAAGHVTERFAVTIPHRGELRGVRVDLVPVRERVFQLYRRAAEPVLPESRLWGIWSPRQIVDHVRSKRPSPALADLTDFVEEIYFSPRVAGENVLPHTSERVERAIGERARR
jgi:hypothetical protein